ncbi:MAG: phosphate acyltransferase PlsX [Gemmatimonadota bacterium]|nr:phosphate acyltransferase PlsX [Gemmatimonadota bacterium]MDE2866238.1 phosphate acyltransferase PlsX [Gemmatimonadota bacterium]
MRIALDAMGTDHAPSSEVGGAVAAVERDPGLEVLLIGDETTIERDLRARGSHDRITVLHTRQSIRPGDSPVSALRRNPRSSIRLGVELQRSGEVDAFVSAGSTGAVMAASLMALRLLPGVDRPALAAPFPTTEGKTLVVDVGANLQCKPQHLVQFARLASIYMQDVEGIERPRVGLLNVGAEEVKGPGVLKVTHRLLARSDLNFVGNIEGRDIIHGACDVLVCDGLSGNVLLKFYESLAHFFFESFRSRLESDLLHARLEDHFREFDYAEYGGVPLLGVNGVCIVCHGASSDKAIGKAVGVATQVVRTGMVAHAERDLAAHRSA